MSPVIIKCSLPLAADGGQVPGLSMLLHQQYLLSAGRKSVWAHSTRQRILRSTGKTLGREGEHDVHGTGRTAWIWLIRHLQKRKPMVGLYAYYKKQIVMSMVLLKRAVKPQKKGAFCLFFMPLDLLCVDSSPRQWPAQVTQWEVVSVCVLYCMLQKLSSHGIPLPPF